MGILGSKYGTRLSVPLKFGNTYPKCFVPWLFSFFNHHLFTLIFYFSLNSISGRVCFSRKLSIYFILLCIHMCWHNSFLKSLHKYVYIYIYVDIDIYTLSASISDIVFSLIFFFKPILCFTQFICNIYRKFFSIFIIFVSPCFCASNFQKSTVSLSQVSQFLI